MSRIPVNIIVGRFQPFTDGHMKLVDAAWKKLRVPTVMCIINTPDEKVDKSHPFPTSLLLPIYNELCKTYKNIVDVVKVSNADIVKIGAALNDKYEIVSWTCGTDRIVSYTNMSTKYKEQAGLADDFQMIEVKRTGEDVSATKVRQALIDGDLKTFNKLTPYETLKAYLKEPDGVYNILREKIMQLY